MSSQNYFIKNEVVLNPNLQTWKAISFKTWIIPACSKLKWVVKVLDCDQECLQLFKVKLTIYNLRFTVVSFLDKLIFNGSATGTFTIASKSLFLKQ